MEISDKPGQKEPEPSFKVSVASLFNLQTLSCVCVWISLMYQSCMIQFFLVAIFCWLKKRSNKQKIKSMLKGKEANKRPVYFVVTDTSIGISPDWLLTTEKYHYYINAFIY